MPAPSSESERSPDESQIVHRLQAGDAQALEFILRRDGPRLLAVARRIVGNEDDANDALQDAFISAFKSRGQFEGGSRLSTWLHRIVVNACLMKLRAGRRRRERSIEGLLPTFLDDGHRTDPRAPWQESSQALLERDETRAMVRRNIDRLPDDYREVILLRDIAELNTEHAAAVLGINEGAVKTRLHRARQALRTLLERELAGHKGSRAPE